MDPSVRFYTLIDGGFLACETKPDGGIRQGSGGKCFLDRRHAAGRLARFMFPAHGALLVLFIAISPLPWVPICWSRSVRRVVGGQVMCDADLSGFFETEIVLPGVPFERSHRHRFSAELLGFGIPSIGIAHHAANTVDVAQAPPAPVDGIPLRVREGIQPVPHVRNDSYVLRVLPNARGCVEGLDGLRGPKIITVDRTRSAIAKGRLESRIGIGIERKSQIGSAGRKESRRRRKIEIGSTKGLRKIRTIEKGATNIRPHVEFVDRRGLECCEKQKRKKIGMHRLTQLSSSFLECFYLRETNFESHWTATKEHDINFSTGSKKP